MSELILNNPRCGTRRLKVVAFSSPLVGQLYSAQTRTMVQYFPIKALQPELELEVVFRNEPEYEDFQRYVRNIQVDAQSFDASPGVTLYWPQRSIYNWTGVIKAFRAGGQRNNFMPRAKFTIDLVDSMLSSKTTAASWATSFEEIFGINTPGGILGSSGIGDSLLTEPIGPLTSVAYQLSNSLLGMI